MGVPKRGDVGITVTPGPFEFYNCPMTSDSTNRIHTELKNIHIVTPVGERFTIRRLTEIRVISETVQKFNWQQKD